MRAPSLVLLSLGLFVAGGLLGQKPETAQQPVPHLLHPGGPDQSAPAAMPAPDPVRLDIAPTGAIRGIGPGYFASLDGSTLTFRPAPSPHAASAETPVLEFRTVSVGRAGGAPLALLREVVPDVEQEQTTLRLRHGAFEERFALRDRGVKHSYVFEQRPTGTGDLVVRLAFDETLAARPCPEGGLRLGPNGEIRIGAVIGIDARGARCDGSIEVREGAIEMRLPADFVDRAALPLELDPWIHAQTNNISFPADIAYLNTLDRYLITWSNNEFVFGTVKAALMDGSGRAIAPVVTLDTSGRTARCAAVSVRDRFVVAWEVRGGLRMVSIAGANGAVSPASGLAIQPGPGIFESKLDFDIAGDSTLSDDDAVLVYTAPTTTESRQVQVRADGTLYLFGRRTLFAERRRPALPSTGGAAGRYLLTMADRSGLLHVTVIDRNLNVLAAGLSTSVPQSDASWQGQSIDGDGTTWLIAWTNRNFSTATNTIYCRLATYDPSRRRVDWSAPRRTLEQLSRYAGASMSPSVAWLGESAVVTTVVDNRVVRHSVNTLDCGTCETRRTVSTLPTRARRAVVAGKLSSRQFGQRREHLVALLADRWNRWTQSFYGAVYTLPQTARDGLVTPMAFAGCGVNTQGEIDVACAAVYKQMNVRLREATPNQSCWLLLSDRERLLPCGTCTVGPYLLGDTYHARTNSLGTANVSISVPTISSLVGVQVYAQWWVSIAGSSGCLGAYLSPGAVIRLE